MARTSYAQMLAKTAKELTRQVSTIIVPSLLSLCTVVSSCQFSALANLLHDDPCCLHEGLR